MHLFTKKLVHVSLVSLRGDLFCDDGRQLYLKTSELSTTLTYPLRYYLLEDLPKLIEIQHKEILKEIIVLNNTSKLILGAIAQMMKSSLTWTVI